MLSSYQGTNPITKRLAPNTHMEGLLRKHSTQYPPHPLNFLASLAVVKWFEVLQFCKIPKILLHIYVYDSGKILTFWLQKITVEVRQYSKIDIDIPSLNNQLSFGQFDCDGTG